MHQVRRAGLPFILVTVFLDMLGIGLVIPILPALVGVFTGSRDAQSLWYGALVASYGLTQFLGAPFLGALSDRYGRRPVLLVAILGLGLNFLLTATARSLWTLLFARLLGGALGASYAVAGAYIADVTTPEQRSRSFGTMGAVFGLGFIFGPALGGWLGGHDLRLPYFAAASLSLLNALYGFFILPESHPPEGRRPVTLAKLNPFAALAGLAKLRGVGRLVAVYALAVSAQFIVQSTWVLFTTFRFGWGPRENGTSLFVVGVAAAFAQGFLLGNVLRWLGEQRTVLAALLSGTVASVFYGFATEGWMMYAIILANVFGFLISPALQGIVSRAADPSAQGVTIGSLNAVGSVMGVVGPLVGTPLLAAVGHLPRTDWRVGITFFLCAGLQALALLLAAQHFRHAPRPAITAAVGAPADAG